MDFELECAAIQRNIISDSRQFYVSQRQIQKLAILFGEGLSNHTRETRLAVLDLLIGDAVERVTGYPVRSFKNLTGSAASFLINLLIDEHTGKLSEYGKELLRSAEARTQALPVL